MIFGTYEEAEERCKELNQEAEDNIYGVSQKMG